MTSNNKVLLLMVAVVALVIGAALNSAKVSDEIDSEALLSARLMSIDSNRNDTSASVEEHLAELTLVNFWASWCAPCRKEMPMFETVYRTNKSNGFQIVGVAIDSPENAQPMLDSMDISYPILYAEQTGMQVMSSAGNPNGYLPYSLLLDKNGQILDQVLGEIHQQQIQAWLDKHL